MTARAITPQERELLRSAGLDGLETAFDASAKLARAQAGKLEQHVHVDKFSGARSYTYTGDKKTWMSQFQPKEAYALARFVVPSKSYPSTVVNTDHATTAPASIAEPPASRHVATGKNTPAPNRAGEAFISRRSSKGGNVRTSATTGRPLGLLGRLFGNGK